MATAGTASIDLFVDRPRQAGSAFPLNRKTMQTSAATVHERPAFLGSTKQLLIGGQWVPAASGEAFDTFNPADGTVIGRLARGGPVDIDRAVAAARAAFEGPWSRWKPIERQRLLLRINDLLLAHAEELAVLETMDMGAPLSRTRSTVQWISQTILHFASCTGAATTTTSGHSLPGEVMALTHKTPLGVVGGIIPWNGPLGGQWWILGPTLATGCTCVLKPAEDASLSVLRFAEIMAQAGVPDGVMNIVTGYGSEAGSALAAHPGVDKISFTGSTETGRKIVAASAGNLKRLQLELGGKSPDIVFADADLDIAVPGAAMGVFSNSGQICYSGTRLFVQRRVQEEFVERLRHFSAGLKVGNGLQPDVDLGPLISARQLDRVMGYVKIGSEEGAVLAAGGARLGNELANGYFVEPTVFSDVANTMAIAREEIFGPVISVIPFDTVDEVLKMANDSEFGLAGGVWTRDLSTAHRVSQGIRSGTVWVNCYGMVDPTVGFGGCKASGYGWKGSTEHVESFLQRKAVYINLN
ncbi:MAG TPA: aldehyde dehydrogenase family protein [Ideonella sp.]|uniref:aldehyde dehydrogenase family protein n=1 Tax=Ideonella sp. TaxID=1929293 RepID=UPI002BD4ED32|nr:aldehyde dehydrogenase family protein [Ideonella sp.]HSI47075.1 aldehyde dehydrogenase family protein [Ideonella sp.]